MGNSLQLPSSRRWRFLALGVLLLAAVSSAWFGLRTYGSLRLLQLFAQSEGGGLMSGIADAVAAHIPLLTSVREPYLNAWRSFHGGLATELAPLKRL